MFGIPQLKPIDIHFGNVLQQAYRFVDPKGHSDGFQRFLSKPEKERIYRGRYDDPRSFLGALRKYQEQQVEIQVSNSGDSIETVIQSFNQATLPSIWYYRNLSYRLADSSNTTKIQGIQYYDESNRPVVVDGIYIDVSYRIIFVAYNTESLDALVSAFLLYLNSADRSMTSEGLQELPSDNPRCPCSRVKGFDIPYTNGFNLPASFGDIQSLSAEVIPGAHEDGRIYAAEISNFPVTVPLLRSSSVSLDIQVPDNINVELWSASNCHG